MTGGTTPPVGFEGWGLFFFGFAVAHSPTIKEIIFFRHFNVRQLTALLASNGRYYL